MAKFTQLRNLNWLPGSQILTYDSCGTTMMSRTHASPQTNIKDVKIKSTWKTGWLASFHWNKKIFYSIVPLIGKIL